MSNSYTGFRQAKRTRKEQVTVRYQSGCIVKRGKHPVWVARRREPIMKNGKEVFKHRAKVLGLVRLMSLRQARRELGKVLKPLNDGAATSKGTAKFSQFLETWNSLIFPTLKPSTQHGYKVILSHHLLPYFGDVGLNEISKPDIQQFVSHKFSEELAWQTVRNCWIVLASVLKSACEYEYIAGNPARGIKFPPMPPKKAPRILTAKEFHSLLKELPEPFKTMMILCVLTGLRIGEVCALRRSDVQRDQLRISRGVHEEQFHSPKGNRERTVPLSPLASQVLKVHLSHTSASPDMLVFHTRTGKPYRQTQIGYRYIAPAAQRAGLGRVTAHQLRHIHSSVLHDQGTPIGIIQKQLGHAKAETTLSIYTHNIDRTHRRALVKLEKALFPNLFSSG